MNTLRDKNGKFMRDWRTKLVKQRAARSRANIERANQERPNTHEHTDRKQMAAHS